jgi:vanillate O-demethylase ferredoxin subunit
MTGTIEVFVKAITYEAEDVISLDLRPVDGAPLPPFTAGAHVELHLANGMRRHYSLANPETERHRYLVGVHKDRASRGGSVFIHQAIRAGDRLIIGAPRNAFPLREGAPHSLLIAGGIGITPIWCMVQRLQTLGRSWSLLFAARSRRAAAFLDDIAPLGAARCHFDDEQGGTPPDLAALIAAAPPGTHVYCCGPAPMLASFEQAAAPLPPDQVHVEYFSAREPIAAAGGFEVVLARTNRTLIVPDGATILDTLLAAGIDAGHSCLEGVCGTCETRVIEGVPDHRDVVLSAAERASNQTIMICCSGAKTSRLVLDL